MSSENENKVFFKSISKWPVYIKDKSILYNVLVEVDNVGIRISKDYPNGEVVPVHLVPIPGTVGFQITENQETSSLVANWLDVVFEFEDDYSKLTITYPLEYIAVMISTVVKMNKDLNAINAITKRHTLKLIK